MAKNSLTLTRKNWKTFKTAHNLSKSSLFKKADVGPTIDKLEKAKNQFLSSPSMKNATSFFKQIGALKKAMASFVKLKTKKAELTDGDSAMKQIETWIKELGIYETQTAKFIKQHQTQLDSGDKKELDSILDKSFL